ncbi:MAG: hypothetical protein ACE5JF_10695 [Anaerolineales bacterium]
MNTIAGSPPARAPYTPSWMDRLTAWLDRMPGPVWSYYLAAAAAYCAVFLGIQASQGAYAGQGFYPWHIFLALQPIFALAMMHYLDHAASGALARFGPAMASGQAQIEETHYRLTTLPARRTWIATVAGVLAYLTLFGSQVVGSDSTPSGTSSPSALQAFGLSTTPLSLIMVALTFFLLWAFMGVLVYHTVQQLNVVRGLFVAEVSVDPFQPEPIYAFSSVTGLTAVLLLLNSYGWVWGVLAGPGQAAGVPTGPVLLVNVFFAALGIFLFVWPLWGAHRVLSLAKNQALARNADHFRTAAAEIHRKVAAKQGQGIDDWHKALAALDLERSQIQKIATWPWRPEALRGLVVAILLPIAIWIIQRLLERFIT